MNSKEGTGEGDNSCMLHTFTEEFVWPQNTLLFKKKSGRIPSNIYSRKTGEIISWMDKQAEKKLTALM